MTPVVQTVEVTRIATHAVTSEVTRLVDVPGAGHNLHQEDPQAVLKALEEGAH